MKKKKLLLSLLLLASMMLSITGCGEMATSSMTTAVTTMSETTGESPTTNQSLADTYPIVDKPITVKGVVVGRSTKTRKDRVVWNKVSEITGINIEWECIDEDALATYLAGSDWPDFIHYNLSSSLINDYGVVGNRFVNYLDYTEYMPNFVQALSDYPIMVKAATQSNGKMYNLPGMEISATVVSARPYMRTDVLDAAGVKTPATVNEFHDALATLKEKEGVASFIPDLGNDESYWGPMLFAAFGTLTNMNFDDDGTGKVIFNRTSNQIKLYLTWMNQLYSEGLIHQEYLTMDGTSRLDAAKSGQVAFIGGGEGNSLQASDFSDGKFHLDCLAPLTSEYDNTQTILGKTGYFPGGGFFMSNTSEYIKELCQMFDIMYATKEVVAGSGLCGQSFCYGIQGTDWDLDGSGTGTYSLTAPDSYNGAFTTYQYEELIWENSGRSDALAGLVTSTPSNGQARQYGFTKNVIPYLSDLYFPVNILKFTEDEQYVLDNKLTDIQTYYKEMEGKFITGVTDIKTGWDEYCQTLDQLGVQDIIDVYQSAYDRWNNT
ncbi:MAG: extracellular solute-binding protein [Clostridiaceae bacterium]|nr:extracellular solute-binding protein [Clostridiaceae bacterium]